MQTITAFLRRFKRERKGISNVIVVMLSLILIVMIVGNVVLWSYQMNQFDIERMQETIQISNVTRVTRSIWLTAQKEFSVLAGSRLSGTYADTQFMDDLHETFREERPSMRYNPSVYILGGSSAYVSGSLTNLQNDDGVYMQFRSYPSAFSSSTETFGNTATGGSYLNIEDVIAGSVFTVTKDGEAQSITAYIRMTASKAMKCAIYLHSNLSLVAQTEERIIPSTSTPQSFTFNFNAPKPTLRADTEYLLVAWAQSGSGQARLYYTSGALNQGHFAFSAYSANFPNPMPTPTHETKAYCIYCTFKPATEEKVEVEFAGNSNTESWTDLTWTINGCFTTNSITTTFQLYNYQTGEYPTSGDGYMTATIGTTDVTATQTITSNPTYFRDAAGNWKLKIVGIKSAETPFDFKADLVEFKVTLSSIYRLEISNHFTVNLANYPLDHIQGLEILVRYNTTANTEKWFIKAYNWTATSFADSGFNNTGGNEPTPNEWNEYAVNVTDGWRSYVEDNGTLLIEFFDEGLDVNQTVVEIDFFAVRAIINGASFDLRNNSPITTHIVSIWIINATYHQRYNANWFINAGEDAVYIRADISLPEEFIAKVVTERGNITVFTEG
ncbi:MAG: hypothetical protein QXH37_00860 [Candidatus Bathyarchaeia archaeon]